MNKIADTNQANNILSDTSPGIYTYCLTRTRVSFPHTMIGIDGTHGVYLAERDGIFVVLSDVSLKEYSEAALDKNMTDMAWLVPRAKRHEEIIEFVMTPELSSRLSSGVAEKYYTPVVPLRFCTIYKNQEGIFNAIMPHKEKILNFLDYTADKTEWSVKVFCDKAIFINNFDKNKEQSATIDQTSLLPGELYLLAKKMRKIKEENFRQDLQMYLKDIDFTLSQ
ncbi:MAG: GvpL/GvpF family gas vesicle protein, partial [Planctomycetota bacterium]|nr:GvpL/GvpF family gas vesicle protein [Planctomycetota bacterium]